MIGFLTQGAPFDELRATPGLRCLTPLAWQRGACEESTHEFHWRGASGTLRTFQVRRLTIRIWRPGVELRSTPG